MCPSKHMWNNYSTEQTEVSWVSLMLCKINATKSYEKVNNKRTKISLQTLYSFVLVLCLVTQWCPTLCNKLTVAHQAPLSMQIFQARILDWVAMPYPRGLPNPGIEPRSPTLQVDSLPSDFCEIYCQVSWKVLVTFNIFIWSPLIHFLKHCHAFCLYFLS